MRTPATLLAAAAAGALLASAAGASAAVHAQTTPRLVAVRAAGHPGFDRVVFEFRGGAPTGRLVRYVATLNQDGSGFRIPVPGRAILQVVIRGAVAHDSRGRPTSPGAITVPLRNVMHIRRAGDFEGDVTYGISLAVRRPITVRTLANPTRMVVDIDNRFPVVARRVYFQNLPNFVRGAQPDVTAVSRRVPAASPATGVMDRLFAGPTATESANGLRLVRSRATGFTGLRIAGGVARVRLTGGCASGGSTFTIANLITPSLTQFPTVDAVKILDPQGRTGNPTGPGSSIPGCLEP